MHSSIPVSMQTIDMQAGARSVSLSPQLMKYDQFSQNNGEQTLPQSISKLRYKHEYLECLDQISNAQTLHLRPNGHLGNVQRLQARLIDGLRQRNSQTIQEGRRFKGDALLRTSQHSPIQLPMIRESNIRFNVSQTDTDVPLSHEDRLLYQLKSNMEIRMGQKQLEQSKRSKQSFSGLDKKFVREIVEHRQSIKKAQLPRKPSPKNPPIIEVYPKDHPKRSRQDYFGNNFGAQTTTNKFKTGEKVRYAHIDAKGGVDQNRLNITELQHQYGLLTNTTQESKDDLNAKNPNRKMQSIYKSVPPNFHIPNPMYSAESIDVPQQQLTSNKRTLNQQQKTKRPNINSIDYKKKELKAATTSHSRSSKNELLNKDLAEGIKDDDQYKELMKQQSAQKIEIRSSKGFQVYYQEQNQAVPRSQGSSARQADPKPSKIRQQIQKKKQDKNTKQTKKIEINEPIDDPTGSEREKYNIVSEMSQDHKNNVQQPTSKSQFSASVMTSAEKSSHLQPKSDLKYVSHELSRSLQELRKVNQTGTGKNVIDDVDQINQHIILNTIYEQRETARNTNSQSPFHVQMSNQSTQRLVTSGTSGIPDGSYQRVVEMPSQVDVMFRGGPIQQIMNSQYFLDGGMIGSANLDDMPYFEQLMSASRLKNYKEFMEELKQTNKQIKQLFIKNCAFVPRDENLDMKQILQENQMKHKLIVPNPGKEAVRISVARPVIDTDRDASQSEMKKEARLKFELKRSKQRTSGLYQSIDVGGKGMLAQGSGLRKDHISPTNLSDKSMRVRKKTSEIFNQMESQRRKLLDMEEESPSSKNNWLSRLPVIVSPQKKIKVNIDPQKLNSQPSRNDVTKSIQDSSTSVVWKNQPNNVHQNVEAQVRQIVDAHARQNVEVHPRHNIDVHFQFGTDKQGHLLNDTSRRITGGRDATWDQLSPFAAGQGDSSRSIFKPMSFVDQYSTIHRHMEQSGQQFNRTVLNQNSQSNLSDSINTSSFMHKTKPPFKISEIGGANITNPSHFETKGLVSSSQDPFYNNQGQNVTFGKNSNYTQKLQDSKRDDRQIIFIPAAQREYDSAQKPLETKGSGEGMEDNDFLNDILKYSDSELKSMSGHKSQPFDVHGDVIDNAVLIAGSKPIKKNKNLVYSNMQGNKTIYNATANQYGYYEPAPSSQGQSSLAHNQKSSRVLLKKPLQPRRLPETEKERQNRESLQKLSQETNILKQFIQKMTDAQEQQNQQSQQMQSGQDDQIEPLSFQQVIEGNNFTLRKGLEEDRPKKLKLYGNRELKRSSQLVMMQEKSTQNQDAVRASQIQMDFLSPLSNRLKELHLHSHRREDVVLNRRYIEGVSQQESQTVLKKDSTASGTFMINNVQQQSKESIKQLEYLNKEESKKNMQQSHPHSQKYLHNEIQVPKSIEHTFEEVYKRSQVANIVAKSLEEKQQQHQLRLNTNNSSPKSINHNFADTPNRKKQEKPRQQQSPLSPKIQDDDALSQIIASQQIYSMSTERKAERKQKELTPPKERRGVLSKSKTKLIDSVKKRKSPSLVNQSPTNTLMINEDLNFDLGRVLGSTPPYEITFSKRNKEAKPKLKQPVVHIRQKPSIMQDQKTSYKNAFLDGAGDPESSKMPIMKQKVNINDDQKESNSIFKYYNPNSQPEKAKAVNKSTVIDQDWSRPQTDEANFSISSSPRTKKSIMQPIFDNSTLRTQRLPAATIFKIPPNLPNSSQQTSSHIPSPFQGSASPPLHPIIPGPARKSASPVRQHKSPPPAPKISAKNSSGPSSTSISYKKDQFPARRSAGGFGAGFRYGEKGTEAEMEERKRREQSRRRGMEDVRLEEMAGSKSASGDESPHSGERRGKKEIKRLNKITVFPMRGGNEQDHGTLKRDKVTKGDYRDGKGRVWAYVSKMPVLQEVMASFTDEFMSKLNRTPMTYRSKFKKRMRDEEDAIKHSMQSSLRMEEHGVAESKEFVISSDQNHHRYPHSKHGKKKLQLEVKQAVVQTSGHTISHDESLSEQDSYSYSDNGLKTTSEAINQTINKVYDADKQEKGGKSKQGNAAGLSFLDKLEQQRNADGQIGTQDGQANQQKGPEQRKKDRMQKQMELRKGIISSIDENDDEADSGPDSAQTPASVKRTTVEGFDFSGIGELFSPEPKKPWARRSSRSKKTQKAKKEKKNKKDEKVLLNMQISEDTSQNTDEMPEKSESMDAKSSDDEDFEDNEANEAYKDYLKRLATKKDDRKQKQSQSNKKPPEEPKQEPEEQPQAQPEAPTMELDPNVDYGGLMRQFTMMANPQAAIDMRLAQVKQEIKNHLKNEKWGNDHLSTFQRDILGPFLQKEFQKANSKVKKTKK